MKTRKVSSRPRRKNGEPRPTITAFPSAAMLSVISSIMVIMRVGVEHAWESANGMRAFVASPPEGFRQTVKAAVDALVAEGDGVFATWARLAISRVNCWSQSFQPRRRASSRAMPRPAAEFAFQVMMRNIASSLPRRILRRALCPHRAMHHRFISEPPSHRLASPFLIKKHKRNQADDYHPEQPEIVDVGQHGRLPNDVPLQHGIGVLRGGTAARSRAGAARRKSTGQALQRGPKLRISRAQVFRQAHLVDLRAPGEHRRHK